MEYVNLQTGFALMGFADHRELKRVKQLCHDRWKPVAYAGDFSAVKEIQAKHWACHVSSGWMDYHYPWQAYQHQGTLKSRPKGKATALAAIKTAVEVLSQKCSMSIHYILIAKL
ncbi:hypothetical protein JAO76_17810 [Pontibacter sp. BT310]|uniref:Uncharacterized protein n=1 Tax=Pontibacter populi TaxID=890055 RepID=A0ABS6XI62_9BACT|nr:MULTISPECIES: hypothetical protein [Pontibacter]MBJ6120067.1 hypothetical protein [Pontibacter sp. BT310]MBR0572496.1 hypothetical protein [Microvirga sp. STS03]MBW3366920.1 hypothetical protein [Pontibacter populi]